MSRIFISHNSQDAKEAVALKQWLAESGWDDVFLDIDAKDGLSPGERWKDALRVAADRCEAILCLVSPTWLASAECKLELRYAETLRKAIFLAIAKPCEPGSLPPDWQWCPLFGDGTQTPIRFKFRQQDTECSFLTDGLDRLKNGLEKAGINAESFPWPPANEPDRAPYRGLKPLEAVDAAVFFGRDADILRGMETLRDIRQTGTGRLLVILGASGSGKSSFMRAGLLPRLARDDKRFFCLPVIRPRNKVLLGDDGLAPALAAASSALGTNRTRGKVEEWLGGGPEIMESLLERLVLELSEARKSATEAAPPSLIIPIDQGEELFNPEGASEAAAFMALLGRVLAGQSDAPAVLGRIHGQVMAVLTIRSDRYERLQSAPELAAVAPRLLDLRPFPTGQFERVINGPAERSTKGNPSRPLKVEPALSDRLLADFAQGADTLPLLGFALEKLCHKYASDGDLTLAEYEGIRGSHETVQAAIFQEAVDNALAEPFRPPNIPPERAEQYSLLHRAFIPDLVRINPETNEPMRQVAKFSTLAAEVHPLIERLVEARLLVHDKDDIEVAHESLLRQWPVLSGWLTEEKDNLRTLEKIRSAAADWNAASDEKKEKLCDELLPHRGELLAEAEKLRDTPGYAEAITQEDRAYLRACRLAQDERVAAAKEEQERRVRDAERIAEEQRKSARNRTKGLLVTTLLSIVALIVAGLAVRQYRIAETERTNAIALKYAAEVQLAEKELPNPIQVQTLLAIESMRNAPSLYASLALQPLLQAAPKLVLSLKYGGRFIEDLAFSPDGRYLAAGGSNKGIRVWETSSGKEIWHLADGATNADNLSFSPDSNSLAGDPGNGVYIWDLRTGTKRHKFGDGGALDLKFSPDGKALVICRDGFVTAWDVESENELWRLPHENVSKFSFNPDGKLLVSYSGDQAPNIRVWKLENQQKLFVASPVTNGVKANSLRFSPDSQYILAVGNANVLTARKIESLSDTNEVIAFKFDITAFTSSADFGSIAAGGSGGVVKYIDLSNDNVSDHEEANMRLPEQIDIDVLAFSPDQKLLASGGGDGIVRLWQVNLENTQLRLYEGTTEVSFSADGKAFAQSGISYAAFDLQQQVSDTLESLPRNGKKTVIVALVNKALYIRIFDERGSMVVDLNERQLTEKSERANFRDFKENLEKAVHGNFTLSPPEKRAIIRKAFLYSGVLPMTGTWDTVTGKPLNMVWLTYPQTVTAVGLTPDGTKLAIGIGYADSPERYEIVLWDLVIGKELWRRTSKELVTTISVGPDGLSFVGASRTALWSMQLTTGKELWRYSSNTENGYDTISAVVLSPDGKSVVSASGYRLVFLDSGNGKQLQHFELSDIINDISFAPHGDKLALGQYKAITIWDSANNRTLHRISRDVDVKSVSFSPDGKTVASAEGKTVRFWDVPNGK